MLRFHGSTTLNRAHIREQCWTYPHSTYALHVVRVCVCVCVCVCVFVSQMELLARLVSLKEIDPSQLQDTAALLADDIPEIRGAAAEVIVGVLAAQVQAHIQVRAVLSSLYLPMLTTASRIRTQLWQPASWFYL